MIARSRACLTLLVCLLPLLSTSCASSRRADRIHPAPTEVVESEGDLQRARELWEESRHRTPPGVSWRALEIENRRRNLEARAALIKAGVVVPPLQWRERGSFDQTGRTHVTTIGSDGTTLFIGTDRGGVFSGTPGGERWVPRSDGLGIGVEMFQIVPGNPEVWLAASWLGPIYLSKDKGRIWSQVDGFATGDLPLRILRDPGRPRTIYILMDGSEQAGGSWERTAKLYRSTDGGIHFSLAFSQRTEGSPDLWIDRVDGGPLYLSTSRGLFRSTDAGSTFQPIGSPQGRLQNFLLAGSEAGAPTFYAAVTRLDGNSWTLAVSEDGGRTWQDRNELGDFWRTLTASITDPDLVFVGGINAYRSEDAGRTLAPINSWIEYYADPENKLHADLPGIDIAIYQGKETVFFNTDGGTFVSEDGGRTVRNITRYGLGNGQYYGILSSRNDRERIAAGSQDQGYQVSHPGSALLRFDQLISGDYGSLTSSDGSHNMLFSAYPGFILLQRTEGGDERELETFDFPVPPGERRHHWIPPLAADPADPNVVFYADRRIWRMQRVSPSTMVTHELPHDFAEGDAYDHVTAFAISPADRNRWYAGTSYGRFWSSRDAGQTWTRSPIGSFSHVTNVLPSPSNPDLCYFAGHGYGAPAVARTADGGSTWEPWARGLPPTLVEALGFDDPVHQELYAATQAGPFRYDRQRETWVSLLGTQAPLTTYMDVEGIPEKGLVRFATYGRGIWDYSPTGGGPCIADDETFCFQNGRFEVKVAWKNFAGQEGVGRQVPGSGAESGLFWFFQPANWELMVKVLDGCGSNQRFWVFSAATTTVQYTLRVRDTRTGRMVEYRNPLGQASPAVTDTSSFPCSTELSAPGGSPAAVLERAPTSVPSRLLPVASAACEDSPTALCLAGRFRLEMDWKDSRNRTGSGQIASLRSSDSGIFWFFSPTNWETLTKIVNGCSLNGHYWVFGAALTNVEYTLRVTDTVTGGQRRYFNPLGVSSPTIADTSAFPCD